MATPPGGTGCPLVYQILPTSRRGPQRGPHQAKQQDLSLHFSAWPLGAALAPGPHTEPGFPMSIAIASDNCVWPHTGQHWGAVVTAAKKGSSGKRGTEAHVSVGRVNSVRWMWK